MSTNLVMRALPEDSELMRLALANTQDAYDTIYEFLFDIQYWRHDAAVLRFRQACPELLDLRLDLGKWKSRSIEDVLLRMTPSPVTPHHRELASLIQRGDVVACNGHAWLVPASRVKEVERFLEFLDPALDGDDRGVLDPLTAFYRRVTAVPGLAVIAMEH